MPADGNLELPSALGYTTVLQMRTDSRVTIMGPPSTNKPRYKDKVTVFPFQSFLHSHLFKLPSNSPLKYTQYSNWLQPGFIM